MNKSGRSCNYSSSVLKSPGRSPLLSTSSQNGSCNYNNTNLQNEMVNIILESCIHEWFPFLKENREEEKPGQAKLREKEKEKSNNVKEARGSKLRNKILTQKLFYKGVKSSNFPLRRLCKTERNIFNLNDEEDDEDVFYNSNSIYMNMLRDGDTNNAEAELDAGGEVHDGTSNDAENGSKLSACSRRPDEVNNANENVPFYDCIAEEGDEISARNNSKEYPNLYNKEKTPKEQFCAVREDMDEGRKRFDFEKWEMDINEQRVYTMQEQIIPLQRNEEGKNKKSDIEKNTGEASCGRDCHKDEYSNSRSTYNATKGSSYVEGVMKKSEVCSSRLECEQNVSKVDDIIENNTTLKGKKIDEISPNGENDTLSVNQSKGDNTDNVNIECKEPSETDTREDQHLKSESKSISVIIQEIKNEEAKVKDVVMDTYGNIYLGICLLVLKKDISYFSSRNALKNEALINEKKKIKEILKLYDKLFYSHFKFIPNKFYKETLRPIYSYYQHLKCTIGGGAPNASLDIKSRKSYSLSKDYEIQKSAECKIHEDVSQAQRRGSGSLELTNLGSFSNIISDTNIKRILLDVDANKDISHLERDYKFIYKDLVKLKGLLLKKRHYKNILYDYQKNFVQFNNRCVKTYRDIYPVEKEYKVYTQIKKETVEVINSINATCSINLFLRMNSKETVLNTFRERLWDNVKTTLRKFLSFLVVNEVLPVGNCSTAFLSHFLV
ncbi:conserved Plasmodium protein, unknown function [Plasmodium ovale curtisi]|uniref:Uncharacterized protein n=1 Tax=Plasmodium ovale curtisi TaxID=864141 RepID=A0A1A8VKE1_PLAOA|nr:conserved Plasmodium protein, unknown function [Plasmodium ovale curtisi]